MHGYKWPINCTRTRMVKCQSSMVSELRVGSKQTRGQRRRHKVHRETPGLGRLTARWLGKRLDKAQQCSDWDARPLSMAQIQYAAADATVLLQIAVAMLTL